MLFDDGAMFIWLETFGAGSDGGGRSAGAVNLISWSVERWEWYGNGRSAGAIDQIIWSVERWRKKGQSAGALIPLDHPSRIRSTLVRQQNRRLVTIFLRMIIIFAMTFIPKAVLRTLLVAESLGSIVDTEIEHILFVSFTLLYYTSVIANPLLTLLVNKDYFQTLCLCRQAHTTEKTSFSTGIVVTSPM